MVDEVTKDDKPVADNQEAESGAQPQGDGDGGTTPADDTKRE